MSAVIRESETEFTMQYTSFIDNDECCPRVNEGEWKELEQKTQQKQKEFLEKYVKDGKFEDVPVSSDTKNVRRGDHVLCPGPGGLYHHHLLCTKADGEYIHTIEYNGPSSGFASFFQLVASSNILAFGQIKEGKSTYEELEKKKAKIRKWPEELQRFSSEKVISRAESRKKERDYHLFNNNCEHFVTWCKCGLNTSLQVTTWYRSIWDCVKAIGSSALESLKKYGISEGVPAVIKAIGNLSDEMLRGISSPLSPVGFVVGGVIETHFAVWYIRRDCKRMNEGRLAKRQFQINSVSTGSKAVGHIVGGIAGSLIGSALFGLTGSIVGGGIGYGVGHAGGSAVGYCYEHAPTCKKTPQHYVVLRQDIV